MVPLNPLLRVFTIIPSGFVLPSLSAALPRSLNSAFSLLYFIVLLHNDSSAVEEEGERKKGRGECGVRARRGVKERLVGKGKL